MHFTEIMKITVQKKNKEEEILVQRRRDGIRGGGGETPLRYPSADTINVQRSKALAFG